MPFRIYLEDSGKQFTCVDGETVLHAMETLGIRGIPVGCRGGGCGVCKVKIVAGQYRVLKMSRAAISVEEEQAQGALSCRLFADSDLRLKVVGKMKRALVAGVRA